MSIAVVVLGNDEHIVRQIEGYRGELMVTRVCDDMAEAVASCGAGLADVLLVADSDLLPPMEQIDYVISQHTVLVVMGDGVTPRPATQGFLAVAESVPMVELELRVVQMLKLLNESRTEQRSSIVSEDERPQGHSGKVLCFWGAVGSPGRSTVALNYAVEAAAGGRSVVLVDADTFGASIAIQLGLLDESASVAQLCRAVDSGVHDPARMDAICTSVQVGDAVLRVATGIPRASRWPEVRASALRRAVDIMKSRHDLVVVDVAASVELDEQLSFDTQAPQRNAVTVEMLSIADEILMVVAADSLGIPRALRAIDELEEQLPGINLNIVFNRLSASNAGRSPKRRILEAWQRFGPMHPIAGYLPNDATTCQAAVLAGTPLLEIAPRSALRTEICALTGKNSTVSPRKRASRRFSQKARTVTKETG